MKDLKQSYEYYYRHNKIYLYIVGLWMFQNFISKYFFLLLTIIAGGSQITVQTGGMIAAKSQDTDVFLESIAPVVVNGLVVPKFINFWYNKSKMKLLYKEITEDWKTFKDIQEIEILRTYAMKTEKTCLVYAGCIYGGLTPVILVPTIPAVLEACGLINQTGTKLLPFPVQYFVDVDVYYYYLICDGIMGTIFLVMVVCATDTMLVLFINHACSIIKIIGYRMQNIITETESGYNDASIKDDMSYDRAVICIKLHNKILKFVEFIEEVHTSSLLVQLGFNVAGVTFTGFQAVMLLHRPSDSFRYLTFTLAQMSHLYFLCGTPQRLYDDSLKLRNDINNGKWYKVSNRTRKLMTLFLVRTTKPCKITAGKFFTMNIETFSGVLRTCMSYFTVLSSQREKID